MQIAASYGSQIACMPCCQKDYLGRWKQMAKSLNTSVGVVMDMLSAGKMIQAGYDVKVKLVDPKITPQNRLIMCRKVNDQHDPARATCNSANTSSKVAKAKQRLEKAYDRAHHKISPNTLKNNDIPRNQNLFPSHKAINAISFISGILLAYTYISLSTKNYKS